LPPRVLVGTYDIQRGAKHYPCPIGVSPVEVNEAEDAKPPPHPLTLSDLLEELRARPQVLQGLIEVSREHPADPSVMARRGKHPPIAELRGKRDRVAEARPSGVVVLICHSET